jgi:hypothetical protein
VSDAQQRRYAPFALAPGAPGARGSERKVPCAHHVSSSEPVPGAPLRSTAAKIVGAKAAPSVVTLGFILMW